MFNLQNLNDTMINVDLTSLISVANHGGAGGVTPPMLDALDIPVGAGDKESWFKIVLICVTLIAVGVGIYVFTCDDGKKAKMTYDGSTASLEREPITDLPQKDDMLHEED